MNAFIPGFGRWLPASTAPLRRSIVIRALVDVGLVEEPPGSNRSPVIDSYLNAVGSPLGSPWCAAAVSAWVRDAGGLLPNAAAGACDSWYAMAQAHGTLSKVPAPGMLVLYSFAGSGRADHMGAIVRVDNELLSVEANTTFKRGTGSEREGIGCTIAVVDTASVLAYVAPEPIGAAP